MSLEISIEQQAVVDALQTQNVIVDSVAGSGKTTTCLEISKTFQSSKILLLTYNRRLRLETQKRVTEKGLKNIQVHNYHSFVVKYYEYQSFDDIKLKEAIVMKKIKPAKTIDFDLFIIDEAQDMNDLFCQTFLKIIMDNQYQIGGFKICVLGDQMQSIYSFNGADQRYITLSDRIFGYLNPFSWERLDLSQSFRLTQQIADFMNKCMLPSDRLFSRKQGPKPLYLICKSFTNDDIKKQHNNKKQNVIYNKIMYFINKLNYKYEDFFILAPSIKNKTSPVGSLSNLLSANQVPIFYPNSDEERIDEDIIKSKMVFSTFHQVKGLERKIVFVYSFDVGYFHFYNQKADSSVCTNELYVAVSRALEQLVLIHDCRQKHLPFLRQQNVFDYCEVEGDSHVFQIKDSTVSPPNLDLTVAVTDLTRHISVDILEQCLSYLDIHDVQDKEEAIAIQQKSEQEMTTQKGNDIDIKETVCEITGTAIPIFFEMQIKNKSAVLNHSLITMQDQKTDSVLKNKIFKQPQHIIDKLNTMKNRMPNLLPEEVLYLANLWNSIKANLNFKMNQITDYSWLSQHQLWSCYRRFLPQVSQNLVFEKELKMFVGVGEFKRHLVGFVDCIDEQNKTVWELKCTEELKGEHYVQLGLYMKIFTINQAPAKEQIQQLQYQIIKIKQQPFEFEEELIYKTPKRAEIICTFIKQSDKKIQYLHNNKKHQGQIQYFTKKQVRDIELKIQELEQETDQIQQQYSFKLFNILTNEIKEIKSDTLRLTKMLNTLITSKYGTQASEEDDSFISKIHQTETYNNAYNKLKNYAYQISDQTQYKRNSDSLSQDSFSQFTSYTNRQSMNNSIQNSTNLQRNSDNFSNIFNSQRNSMSQQNNNIFNDNKSNKKNTEEQRLNNILNQYLYKSSPQKQFFSNFVNNQSQDDTKSNKQIRSISQDKTQNNSNQNNFYYQQKNALQKMQDESQKTSSSLTFESTEDINQPFERIKFTKINNQFNQSMDLNNQNIIKSSNSINDQSEDIQQQQQQQQQQINDCDYDGDSDSDDEKMDGFIEYQQQQNNYIYYYDKYLEDNQFNIFD